jgi:hypothetical protein
MGPSPTQDFIRPARRSRAARWSLTVRSTCAWIRAFPDRGRPPPRMTTTARALTGSGEVPMHAALRDPSGRALERPLTTWGLPMRSSASSRARAGAGRAGLPGAADRRIGSRRARGAPRTPLLTRPGETLRDQLPFARGPAREDRHRAPASQRSARSGSRGGTAITKRPIRPATKSAARIRARGARACAPRSAEDGA